MKAVIVTFCFCLLALSANAYHETKYDTLEVKWSNGNLKEYVTRASHLGNEKGFLPHGIYRSYHENGQLEQEGHYKYNVKIGTWSFWDENGNRSRDMSYDNGILNGQYFEWHHDHSFKIYGHYSKGYKTGLWIFTMATNEFHLIIDSIQYYREDAILVALEGFNRERLHDDHKFYNPDLDLWVEWTIHNASNILYNYLEFSIGKRVDGKKQGKWNIQSASGELIRNDNYEKDVLKN